MKITILIAIIYLMSFSKSLCQSEYVPKNKDDYFATIQTLLKQGFNKNKLVIYEMSKYLNDSERYNIYSKFKKDGRKGFFLNMILTFGIGSFVEGDYVAGLGIALMEVVGIILINTNETMILTKVGTNTLIMSYIAGLIKPWIFSASFNSELKDVLRADYIRDFSLNPKLKIFANGQLYPELCLSIYLK